MSLGGVTPEIGEAVSAQIRALKDGPSERPQVGERKSEQKGTWLDCVSSALRNISVWMDFVAVMRVSRSSAERVVREGGQGVRSQLLTRHYFMWVDETLGA